MYETFPASIFDTMYETFPASIFDYGQTLDSY